MGKEKKRWPLTLAIVAAVVIASAAMIYSFRDAPGQLPMSAISDKHDIFFLTYDDWDEESSGQTACQFVDKPS